MVRTNNGLPVETNLKILETFLLDTLAKLEKEFLISIVSRIS